jgi:hypothetical protein
MYVPRMVLFTAATALVVAAQPAPVDDDGALIASEPMALSEPLTPASPEGSDGGGTPPEPEPPESPEPPEPELPPTLTFASEHGAVLTFFESPAGWRWTHLSAPGAPEGWPVSDRQIELAAARRTESLAHGWDLVEAGDDHLVFQQTAPHSGVQVRRVYTFGAAPNAVRIETWLRSPDGPRVVTRIALLDARFGDESFHETGAAPASFPLFADALFAGIEHVSGEATTDGERIYLQHRPRVAADETWQLVATAVVGWPMPGMGIGLPQDTRVREAFLGYLDTIRIKPARMVLHSQTWWTLPPPLHERDVLNDIEALKRGFFDRTGMFFDTYALDLGWSDPRSLWRIETRRFPNEFRSIHERLAGLGARLGLWFSPGSGYPDGLSNGWLQSQGYELTPFAGLEPGAPCMALGTRYQREFKERVVNFTQQYGLGHLIFDFMALRCDVPGHGHPTGPESRYAIDAGLADVLDAVRAINPNIALEPMVCGYPPSPWWLMKTPFILGPAGDDVPYGRVPSPEWMESLITARDVAYRTSQESWLMPTQALETWDIIVQTPGEFENTAVMAIGRGRWFLSSYLRPELMKPEDWDFYAALVRWARQNQQYLENAWMIGGNPEDRDAYGYLFRHAGKDLFCVRNPWIEERYIELPPSPFAAEPRELRMLYPRRATLARIEPGAPGVYVKVGPYETLFLETVPAADETAVHLPDDDPDVRVMAPAPRLLTAPRLPNGEQDGIRFFWDGSLVVPDVKDAELCILVEGDTGVEYANCKLMLGGREVKPRRNGSAGQFGAATDPSPDHWTWFIVPVTPGLTTFQIDLTVLTEEASIAVYLRGTTPAHSDPKPEAEAVFPVFNPQRRPWSHTLVPLRRHVSEVY